jgi:short-subunit dehydrogenase
MTGMSLPAATTDATVLITGASSGIGTELARALAARGYNLTVNARGEDRLAALADELRRAHGVRVDVHSGDLGDPGARAELIETLRTGELEVVGVCNNAGFGSVGRFHELPLAREQHMVRLNVDALHELTGAFLVRMVERASGAILNVASTASFQPVPGLATYAATKAFVASFSEAVHTELAGTGVSCTSLSPGPTRTEFGERAGVSGIVGRSPDFLVDSPADVARQAVDAMLAGKRSVIPSLRNKASALGGRFVPRTILLPAISRIGGAGARRASEVDEKTSPV